MRREKGLPCLWIGRFNRVIMAITPKAICGLNGIPINIQDHSSKTHTPHTPNPHTTHMHTHTPYPIPHTHTHTQWFSRLVLKEKEINLCQEEVSTVSLRPNPTVSEVGGELGGSWLREKEAAQAWAPQTCFFKAFPKLSPSSLLSPHKQPDLVGFIRTQT